MSLFLVLALGLGAVPEATGPASLVLQPGLDWDIAGSQFSLRHGSRVLIHGYTATDLDLALAEVPDAARLAREAHRDLVWGRALYFSGLSSVLVGAVGVAVGAAQTTDSGAQVGLGTTGGVLVLAGIVATILGIVDVHSGLHQALEAVNLYNVALLSPR